MSGAGAPTASYEPGAARGMRVAVVASSWHTEVMGGLVAGARQVIEQAGASTTVIPVPGSFELPIVAQACAASGEYEAVVALGVVIRGGTPHFEYVCDAATSGLQSVAIGTGIPVGFGLLTCDDEHQALDRSGLPGSRESKGAEAAEAAIATALILRDLHHS